MSHNSRKIHKICKWSFRRTGKLFVFFVCWSLCGLVAFMGQCSAIFFTSESKNVEEVKIKPGRGFKRCFKQTENALLFLQALHFPNFPPDIFLKTQRHLFVVINFKTDGSKEFSFWKIFILLYLQITFYRDIYCNSRVFPSFNIGHHTSSKHWPAGNFTKNESIRAYYRSTPRESSIKRINDTNCFPTPPKS